MRVTKIAETMVNYKEMVESTGGQFEPEDIKGEDVIEFAGRACYQSWDRPNTATASNAAYIRHLLDVKHVSVLYHGSVSFYVTGVSRSLTHELVRHTFLHPSQLSQRFVDVGKTMERTGEDAFIVPPLFSGDTDAHDILANAWMHATVAYDQLIKLGTDRVNAENYPQMTRTMALKRVREAARAVLPNMTPTAIVVTGNHQAWRAFIVERSSAGADLEIRDMARKVWMVMRNDHPALYADLNDMVDGSIVSDGGWRG